MQGTYKKFDKELFEANDLKARTATKLVVAQVYGVEVRDNPDKYGPDLMAYKDGEFVGYVECEIKRVWGLGEFQYDTVQFPERKAKFLKLGSILFIMFNQDLSRCLMLNGETLASSPQVVVRNKYCPSGELFFQVPRENVEFLSI